MKKVNLLFCSVCLVLAGLVSSCNKDTTNDTSISFAGDTGFTAADATVTAGSTFTVKWTVTSSTKMGYFSILKDGSAYDVWSQKEIPSASNTTYIDQVTITAPLTAGTYTYDFVVYDKDKVELARKSIVITVTAAAAAINSYTAKLVGAQGNTSVGSSFSTSTGDVFLQPDAVNNASKVDFIYYYKSDNNTILAEIISPAFGAVNLSNYVTWNNPNSTKFAKTTAVSSSDFDAMTNDAKITSAVDAITWNSEERVINLVVGDIFAFKTAAGKYGLSKVTAVTAGAGSDFTKGSITITVKVQK